MKYDRIWTEENSNCFDAEYILLNYGIHSRERWGQGIRNGMIFVKGFNAEFFLSEQELKKESESWYDFLMNRDNFLKVLSEMEALSFEMRKSVKELVSVDLSGMTDKELFDFYVSYSKALGSLSNCYIVTQPHRVVKIERELMRFIESRGVEDAEHCFLLLTASSKKLVFSREGNRFFENSFSELLQGEESEIDRSLAEVEMCAEELVDDSEKARVIAEMNPSEDVRHMIDLLDVLGHKRFKTRFFWMQGVYFNELFLMEFKRRHGVRKSELRNYDSSELDDLVLSGVKVSGETLSLRERGFLKVLGDSKVSTYHGEEAVVALRAFVDEVDEGVIRGKVASEGCAVGRVVLLSYKDSWNHSAKIAEMSEGDVVVTEMTRPNIISACEKAGAIVTDEGGILCHAAIISRELDVPCVIGTRVATSVLRDGDYVCVDANKGTVTKVSERDLNLKN